MFTAYVVVTVLAAGANIYTATNDFTRAEWVLANMTKLGVPHAWLFALGALKAAGVEATRSAMCSFTSVPKQITCPIGSRWCDKKSPE